MLLPIGGFGTCWEFPSESSVLVGNSQRMKHVCGMFTTTLPSTCWMFFAGLPRRWIGLLGDPICIAQEHLFGGREWGF